MKDKPQTDTEQAHLTQEEIKKFIQHLEEYKIEEINGSKAKEELKAIISSININTKKSGRGGNISRQAVQDIVNHFEEDLSLSLSKRDETYQKLALVVRRARSTSQNCPLALKPYINSYKEEISYINATSIIDILNLEESRIGIDTLNGLVEHYKRREFLEETDPEKRQEKLEEVFEKIATLAVLAGKTDKIVPAELIPYMAFHVGFTKEKNTTQAMLNGSENLQHFAYAFRNQLNSKIIKENDTPLQNRRFDALGRLIQYNSQCSAVCFDGKQILVAFNEMYVGNKVTQIDEHTAKVFKYLQDYATYTALPKE